MTLALCLHLKQLLCWSVFVGVEELEPQGRLRQSSAIESMPVFSPVVVTVKGKVPYAQHSFRSPAGLCGCSSDAASFAGLFVSITVAPPPLPVYVQPVCPPGYMWTPGYWAWGDDGYYSGSGNLGSGTSSRIAVDARVRGLVRRIQSLERRVLGDLISASMAA